MMAGVSKMYTEHVAKELIVDTQKPLAIDLYCGLGGWTEGLLAEGYRVVGFDLEQRHYGEAKYPARLVIQDVLTLHGSQFKDAALIVASPPCQFFSYCAMPWSRAKQLAADVLADPARLEKELALFKSCFRIQREASEAAGRHIPMVVENVKGAQKWVGRAGWHYGSFYLWGDIPALMPIAFSGHKNPGFRFDGSKCGQDFTRIAGHQATKNNGGSWFNVAHNTESGHGNNPVNGEARGPRGGKLRHDLRYPHLDPNNFEVSEDGVKGFTPNGQPLGKNTLGRRYGSKSTARTAASAAIAKIPFVLAQHIARAWKPGP
jgi:hypothetical protein